jgi:hypothetical protein
MKGTKKARRRIGFGLGKFEVVAAFAGVTVVFGIWIESSAEIRWAFKHHVWVPQAVGAILIVLGVFAEVVITALAAREARRADLDAEERIAAASIRVAEISERAANAERAAAEANERAEQERRARVAMLAQLKPRDFTRSEMDTFVAAINGKITALDLFILTDDPEVRSYGFSVNLALLRADVTIREHWLDRFPIASANTGLHVYEKPIGMVFDVLAEAFGRIGKSLATLNPELQREGLTSPSLFIGRMPPAFMTVPEYSDDPSDPLRPKAPWE